MRHLHCPDRWRGGALLRYSDQWLRRPRHRDARRARHPRRARCGAAGLHRRTGRTMRLLPQRHDHDHQGTACDQPAAHRAGGAGGAALQSLSLRHAYRNPARRDACVWPARRGRWLMASPVSNGAERQSGSLVVVRTVDECTSEIFVRITADGSVTAYNGHVDLGTGIRTALGQIVAEELDVSFARVVVVLGDTAVVPNQGATIASETIQITAVPLRKAAAQAHQYLIARAAERLEAPVEELSIEDGLIRGKDNRSLSYG